MKDSNDLHRLIRSLTKSEKRFFKLYCSTEKGEKNYLLLFDEVDKQEEYDEEKLKKKFIGKSFLNQFSVLKHELYNKILAVLTIVNSDKTAYARIRSLNTEAEILRSKKLFSQALKRLSKAKALCEAHGIYELMVEVLALERSCASELLVVKTDEQLDSWYKDLYESIDKLKNYFDYHYWIDFLNMNVLYPSRSDQQHIDQLYSKILASPVLQNVDDAKTPVAKNAFHYIHMTHSFYIGEWEKGYHHSLSRLRVFESIPGFTSARPNGYASAIANHFLGCKHTRRWDEAEECIQKLKELPAAANDPVVRCYIISSELALHSFHLPTRLPSILLELEDQATELFARLDNYNGTMLLYNKAYAHFVIGDHRNALRTIAQIKGNSLSFKEDIQLYIRMLELMIHYEKQNDDLMQPLVNSFYRFIKRRASLTPFENELLHFFTNIYKQKESFNMREFYQRLQEMAATDTRNLRVLEYLDIFSWVKSKAAKQSMREIIEENSLPGRLAS